MIHGVINVYKESGWTSHDVVAKLRGICGQQKIGHTGTLDPDAEGVLPVCLGCATRASGLLTDREKTYRAVLRLGVETDTQDLSGEVLRTGDVSGITEAMVRETVADFVGEIEQIPPMYSARKVDGERLYRLARQGQTVERAPRRVTIHAIDIGSVDLPRVTMTVRCSKGTYIRTLCHDIGERLGCGGAMEHLTRLESGGFLLADALRIDEIQALRDAGRLLECVHPVEELFLEYPRCAAVPGADSLLRNGNPIPADRVTGALSPGWIRMTDSTGVFCGIYAYEAGAQTLRAVKMFLPEPDDTNDGAKG